MTQIIHLHRRVGRHKPIVFMMCESARARSTSYCFITMIGNKKWDGEQMRNLSWIELLQHLSYAHDWLIKQLQRRRKA